SVADAVAYALEREGFEVTVAREGKEALEAFASLSPDLVVLDLMLPGMSGWDLLGAFRRHAQVPVIMLTARAEEPDRVAGLEMGADDYVTKPFSMRELVARVRAVLRRATNAQDATVSVLEHGGVRVDLDRHEATSDGKALELSPKEFDLLAYLLRHVGRTRTREQILSAVWGDDSFIDHRTVDVHVRWLRLKIEQDPANPQRLLTVRGVGYKFADD
ncbi:MAG: response regulator transcription factor, partial [Armatimonadetes bacterium]|nr:response regulator transcription factor [Armatimonadota bacterium]